ncbi:DUF2232 domain-containing protein [Rhizobium sp. CB3090]|uniref:DUF2232 domain-containing protein n=1 Tax=Rhizobium sp. CB3090 TaxID=3039156 RepID=UPI0024B128DD|nr:DUF2232 domain-containing protein [Rhizobium sp. CB3090]WFU10019.1 DUF2232 domain-containing protein [Rhizobium sp. CB3090]
MKKLNAKELGIGALAGLTAALLVYGALRQPFLAIVFISASALPILIVGLGWGNIAVATAVVAAGIFGIVIGPLPFALTAIVLAAVPAWLSHLASLARPASELGGPDHLMAWYPLSDIMLHLCAVASIAIVAAGVLMGYGPDLIGKTIAFNLELLNDQQQQALDAASIEKLKTILLYAVPFAWGMCWVSAVFAAYYFATRIVVASGRSQRPREDIPSALRMNRNAIFVFLAAIVAIFFGGVLGLVAAAVLGAFGAGFIVSGFASLHYRTRGKDWRLPVLILCYLVCFFVTLPLFIVLVLGLYDTRKAISLTPNKNADTPKQDTKI